MQCQPSAVPADRRKHKKTWSGKAYRQMYKHCRAEAEASERSIPGFMDSTEFRRRRYLARAGCKAWNGIQDDVRALLMI